MYAIEYLLLSWIIPAKLRQVKLIEFYQTLSFWIILECIKQAEDFQQVILINFKTFVGVIRIVIIF